MAWGTVVDLLVSEPEHLAGAVEILERELALMDLTASRFRPDSELTRLNSAKGCRVTVSPHLLRAVEVAVKAAEMTDGAVDPTVGAAMCQLGYDRDFDQIVGGIGGSFPSTCPVEGWRAMEVDADAMTVRLPPGVVLDLGATAKALAADLIAELVLRHLGCGVLVSLGGDLAIAGQVPPDGFKVAVGDRCDAEDPVRAVGRGGPAHSDRPIGTLRSGLAGQDVAGNREVVALFSGGLATSGVAVRRWELGGRPVHHIVDPATGLPADPAWSTVTVAAASCVEANTASTATIVKGLGGLEWLASIGLPARLISSSGERVTVGQWPAEAVSPITGDAGGPGFRGAPTR